MSTVKAGIRPIAWVDGSVRIIDQTLLPHREEWLELRDCREVVAAIREMRIRGAPAIGVAGAYAIALAAAESAVDSMPDFLASLEEAASDVSDARPTGANLAWAVERMLGVARRADAPSAAADALVDEAQSIQEEDESANRAIGRYGGAPAAARYSPHPLQCGRARYGRIWHGARCRHDCVGRR